MGVEADPRHRGAFTDWLACAAAGRDEPTTQAAAAAAAGVADRVTTAAVAGHILDFDDTYEPGLAHLSAPTAPTALVLGAQLGAAVGDVLRAYAEGFEAMAALARASHPALYDRGWHPTAVCGVVGSARAAAALLDLDEAGAAAASALALLRAGGLRAAFGSPGKALQVGMAAGAGVQAARLVGAGARVPVELATAPAGFEAAYDGRWAEPAPDEPPAVSENWIKAYPCCLQTHAAIEAAAQLVPADESAVPPRGALTVAVHPVSRQAAPLDDVATGLEAKFSIPYTTALTLLHGAPGVTSFAAVDPAARELARRIAVRTDATLATSAAVLEVDGAPRARVDAARGSPARPLDEGALAAKVRSLAGDALSGVLDDPARPAAAVLVAAGLG